MTYKRLLNFLVILVLLGGGLTLSVSAQTPEEDASLPGTAEEDVVGSPASELAPAPPDLPDNYINAFWFDDFNRPNGPLGGNWTVHGGTINVVSQYAQGVLGGGSNQRATYNGATTNVVQADVAMNGTGDQFSGLILNHDGSTNSDYIYFKVQNQDGDNLYEYGACYDGNDAAFGLEFFPLDAPFETGHVRIERIGNDLYIDLTNIDGGAQPDQNYVCSGAPSVPGNLAGMRFWENGRLDNWCAGSDCDNLPGLLYVVRESDNVLRQVNLNDMTLTDIGPLGVTFEFGGLTYDPNSDTLYMIDGRGAESLYTVDRNTGAATLVGAHGVTDLFGLAYDSSNDVLYATQFSGGTGFYSLDIDTGVATFIGDMGRGIGGLSYNPNTDQLVGVRPGFGDLYEIDRATGATTLLYDGDYTDDSGLTYDPDRNLYWDIDWSGDFYSYDPDYGYIRLTHLSGLGAYDGAAYVPAPDGFTPSADYVAAIWSDDSVHLLDDGLIDQSSFPAGAASPNGIATDGTIIWTGHFGTEEIIGYNFAGTELFRWSGTLNELQGMELVEGDLAVARSGNIEFFHPYDGTFIRSIPSFGVMVEGIAYDGTLIWQIADANLYGIDPADGSLVSTIPNAASGCQYEGTGITAHTPGQLTLACTDGSWYKVSSADGSVLDSGNNGLNMYGLKATTFTNTPPMAGDDAYTTDEDTPFTTDDVLFNDSDAEGPIFFDSYDDSGLLGLLSYNGDGTFDYDPDGQFEGLGSGEEDYDAFTYTISDTGGLTDTATVVITVTGVNDPPMAYDDVYTTSQDTPLVVAAPGVLEDDDDPEGDALQAMWDSGPDNGALALEADGSFVYTPTAGFSGVDSFGYYASDGLLDSSVATVTLNVTEAACTEVSTASLTLLTGGTIYPNDPVDFLLDLMPDDFTPPYSYTVDYDDGAVVSDVDSQDPMTLPHSYAATGTYQVMIETWNCDMSAPVTATVEVVVDPEDVCVPLESIDILGATSGAPGEYTFDTDYDPAGATPPISYTWDDGGTGASSIRTFNLTGTYNLVVTATNCTDTVVTDTHTITITGGPVCTDLTTVSLSYTNAGTVYIDDRVDFSADLIPNEATKPYSYTLDYGDGSAPVDGTSSDDPFSFNYTYAATDTYTVAFWAWNCDMTEPISDTVQVVVTEPVSESYTVYLPIVVRND